MHKTDLRDKAGSDQEIPRVSVVIPCLNEEESIGGCLAEIARSQSAFGAPFQVIVVDNGSTDGSAAAIREGLKAFRHGQLVNETKRGYGAAYLAGFKHVRAPFIFMADGDGSYDFMNIPRFMEELQTGPDVILGDRFAGKMNREAMPFMHRYVGNPVLSAMLRVLLRSGVHDAHSGMRAFRSSLLNDVRLESPGMEFASEMIVAFMEAGATIRELPIDYRPRQGDSKLRPFRDGLRHVRFMLVRRFKSKK